MLDAVTCGTQVVEQDDLRHVQFRRKNLRVYRPWEVRGAHVVVTHWSGHTKSRRDYWIRCQVRRRQPRKFLHNPIELREFLARKSLAEHTRQRAALLREQRKITFRTTDITRQDHPCPRVLISIAWSQRHPRRVTSPL